jgi:hypothetical protein
MLFKVVKDGSSAKGETEKKTVSSHLEDRMI